MSTHHHHACDCAAHRAKNENGEQETASAWAGVLPMLACLVCPACLATYAKLFSMLGVTVGVSELHHSLLLAFAVLASVLVSAWRSVRARKVWPVAFALLGSSLVLAGHLNDAWHELEWAGVLVMLAAGVFEQLRVVRLARGRLLASTR